MYYIRQSTGLFIILSLGIFCILICSGALYFFKTSSDITFVAASTISEAPKNTLTIGTTTIDVELATTPNAWTQGLSGRDSLAPNTGLFFIFNVEDQWDIWMKDMNFPIDVLWITKDMKVSDIVQDMTPGSYPKTYVPHQNVLYVLEVPAGTVASSSIKVGDSVQYTGNKF